MDKVSEKNKVIAAIRQCGNCVSFDKLTGATGLSFIELSSIIGMLLKENRLSICTNPEYRLIYKPTKEYLYDRFIGLLAQYYMQERSVTFYASKLCITPKYLSTVIKQVCGKTASACIKESILKGIEYQLCHSNESIKCIAYKLKFKNQSSFGKFFKAEKGMSPQLYRKTYAERDSAPTLKA